MHGLEVVKEDSKPEIVQSVLNNLLKVKIKNRIYSTFSLWENPPADIEIWRKIEMLAIYTT